MLRDYEKGFAVIDSDLNGISFDDVSFEKCKRFCRAGSVIVERIPYIVGYYFRCVWLPYWDKFIYFNKEYKRCNIYKLHINWGSEHRHKIGKIVYEK